jgi:hypothetical protein
MHRRNPLTVSSFIMLVLMLVPVQSAGAAGDTLDQSPIRTTPDGYAYVYTDMLGKQHVPGHYTRTQDRIVHVTCPAVAAR